MTLLLALLLSQATPTVIVDPTVQSKRAPVTNSAPGSSDYGLNVRVVSQPAGGASVTQGTAADGGLDWATRAKLWDGTDTADVTAANRLQVDPSGVTSPVSAASLPLPSGASTAANQTTIGSQTTKLNDGTDTASITAGGLLQVDGSGVTQPISGTVTANLAAGANNIGDVDVLTVPAPLSTTGGGTEATALRVTVASDSTGVLSVDDNGASLTVDSTQLPAALVGGRLDENVGAWLGSTAPTVGSKTSANSVPVVIASDQGAVSVSGTVTVGTFPDNEPFNVAQWGGTSTTLGQKAMTASVPVVLASDQSSLTVGTHAVTQSGTWTVQPGNTANSTPWLTTDTPRTVASANNAGVCVSVTTGSTTVLASNASRRAYGFKASEANTDRVYCKLGATAVTTNMPFGAGAAWSQDTGAVYTGVVDCIAGSGTQQVCPYEFN